MSDAFAALQSKLGAALEANRAGSTTPHVMIALPSYSVSESLMSHYSDRIAVLEPRCLNAVVIAGRIAACEMAYVSTRAAIVRTPAEADATYEAVRVAINSLVP